ncbi:hypothetical protein NKR23_g11399 [Pleurostoma richardsiae]|uniref:N-acetyltransferase domain-containing protein n=1 Tax=Pleurostoma richardsiae TaxID=41990 RepID=A0AA38RAN8_9PEZI|nr:hypothetical protein NKR23_g11399 [Pleurostoma richardsiae]
MPLRLFPAAESDAPRAAELEHAAYSPSPFNKVLFPGPFPPEALGHRAAGLAEELKNDPTVVWLKVVDTDIEGDDKMIAFAKWHIYESPSEPSKPRTFGPGCNVEACEELFGGLARMKQQWVGSRSHLYLHLLHTDPKHQRRGAGALLTQWGLDEAARRGLPAYLHSSMEGHALYLKLGFKDLEEHVVDLTRFGAPDLHRTFAMIREAQ